MAQHGKWCSANLQKKKMFCRFILMSDGMMNRPHVIIIPSANHSDLPCFKKRRTRIINRDASKSYP